jgi:hypothetical protein
MSWAIVNGDERILPSQGMVNEVKLESGKPKRLALLGQDGPYSFFQHSLESEKIENGQTTTMFRTVNCPKTKANPNAYCPLCEGQQARRRIRHSIASWDYEENSAKLLTNGDDVFKPMGTLGKMGMDPGTMDWVVSKTGTTKNDTSYSSVNVGPKTLQAVPEGTEIPDPKVAYTPHTVDQMKEIVDGMGLCWDTLIVPPAIQYPGSLREALDHVIPNTKYKGQTMEQVWTSNKGMIEFFSKSNRVSPEKAGAQVILVALGGIKIDGVPDYSNGGAVVQSKPQQTATVTQPVATGQTQVNQPVNNANVIPPSEATGEKQAKIKEINQLLQTNQKFVKGGYAVIMDTMKTAGNGKTSINDFSDVELDKMLELSKAE